MFTKQLTFKQIFWFWLPLAAMWLIMSVEQPALTAVVSRLPEAKHNLAAFGLAFAFSLLIESPIMMLLTAAAALATHRQAYHRLLQGAHLLNFGLTAIHLLLAITPLYGYILREWIGTPPEIIPTSNFALMLMFPWSAMIGYRRLLEGVMIRFGQPKRVTIVIIVRLVATLSVAIYGLMSSWNGAYVGSIALSVGVTVGAITAWWLARPIMREQMAPPLPNDELLDWKRFITFYTPLALTSIIGLVGQPILAYGLSRAAQPLESLAIWPVVMSLIFIGRTPGFALQEVGISLLSDAHSFSILKRFVWIVALTTNAIFLLVAITPLSTWWYANISGLEPQLVQISIMPTLVMSLVPGLSALMSWYRAILVQKKNTPPIGIAIALGMSVLVGLMVIFPFFANVPGAVLAAFAFTAAIATESLYLWYHS